MKKILIAILLLAIAGFAAWYFLFNKKTEEELIIERLENLVQACSKNSNESGVVIAMKNSEISNYIASRCSVSIKQMMMNGTYTPMEFAGSLSRSRILFSSLRGSVYDVEINVNPDQISATADYSVRVLGQRKQGEVFDESRDLRSEMIKEDDKWKFASFEIREVLEK